MKNKFRLLTLLSIAITYLGTAQDNQKVVEDFKPSTLNQPGKEYPPSKFSRLCPF